jgi:hypothetical protein
MANHTTTRTMWLYDHHSNETSLDGLEPNFLAELIQTDYRPRQGSSQE